MNGCSSRISKFKTNTVGGSPTASHFLLLRQKKVTQEKATPIRHPFGVPCVARLVRLPHKLARSATRPRAQTYSSEFPDPPPLLGGGTGEGKAKTKIKNQSPRRWAQSAHLLIKKQRGHSCPHKTAFEFLSPVRRLDISQTSGDLGEHCPSSAAGHVLCAPLGRVAQPRLFAKYRGNPEGAANRGRLLLVTFLGKTRKVTCRRATPGNLSSTQGYLS